MGRTATKIAPKNPEPLVEFFPDIEQGSDQWFEIRLGIPTASCFSMVMADGRNGDASKMRRKYMVTLAGEILSGRPAEGSGRTAEGKIVTAAMQRGKDMEPSALAHYERSNIVKLDRVGFVRRRLPSGRYVGCSPDAMLGKRKAIEVKTMAPGLMVDMLDRGAGIPSEHRSQVYGTMWIADLDEVDLFIFYEGMKITPKFTIVRNETVIKEISNAVQIFDHELHRLVQKMRAMGA